MPEEISLNINGRQIKVPGGCTVAAAVWRAGIVGPRRSVSGESRAPLCGMGVCFECRVMIDGRTYQRSCQTLCTPGMEVQTDGR
jgi:predicted molibdopterin-dependent oxidoreductase YjgC